MNVRGEQKRRSFSPLGIKTPRGWAETVRGDEIGLLNDHAHLEKKAAQNALDLLLMWPRHLPTTRWLKVLSAVAKDETAHLAQVLRLLAKRGAVMSRAHRSTYASELRARVRKGRGPDEVIDRLLVSALIEARSAERFEHLADAPVAADLQKLYAGLWASEQGHFRIFLELAAESFGNAVCDKRFEEWRVIEKEIITAQPVGPSLHGWV